MNYFLKKKKTAELVLFLGLILISTPIFSQSRIMITKEYDGLCWLCFIDKVEQNNNIRFYFDQEMIPDFNVSIVYDSILLERLLIDHLKPYNVLVSIDHAGNIFLTKEVSIITSLPTDFFQLPKPDPAFITADTSKLVNDKTFLQTTTEFFAQTLIVGTREKGVDKKKATISGFIKNSETGSPIFGATIVRKDLGTGVAANENGFYKLDIDKGKHILSINSVSTIEKKIEVEVLSDGNLDIFLNDKVNMLEDVIISAQKYGKVRGPEMGIERIPMIAVKKVPLVFGEQDILKIALLLPGVQSVGEGSSGFNVRGSPIDQNIFYINKAPIYNTSHVAGFFSAFNSDAISEFSLYKNYIPINYGGRLSSVFDIRTKQGSMDKTKVNGGIGLITGSILAEGPIKNDTSSFLIAARSTYSNWILSMLNDLEIGRSKIKFTDVITNLSFNPNARNQLNIFSYFSNDDLNLATNSKYDYQNYAASAIWKHYFKRNQNLELSLVHSTYAFNEENSEILSYAYKHLNKISHSEIIANFNINPHENHKLILGINSVLYHINRGNPAPLTDESRFMPITLGTEKGIESGIFISDEWVVSPKLTINGGFRYNRYTYLGPQKVFEYLEGFPKSENTIKDTLFFENNEAIKTHQDLDFRFGANYLVNNNLSLKVAYNRLHQYMYMLSNTVAIAPNYKWKLTDYNTEPMTGDQFSLGMYSHFPAFRIELSIEAYYKKVQNLVELKNGASLFLNEFIERSTLQGKLDAYGLEIMIKKPYGSITGWINYTYSSSSVLIDSDIKENKINFGLPYPSNYDKPHALNLVLNRDFSKRFSMSANFVYATGRPITYPVSLYYLNGVKYLNYSRRNENRIPDYTRLDVSFNLEGNLKKHKIAHGYWSFSIYNLLGRKNAYSIYFTKVDDKIKGYKFSVFGSQIYSITYNFKLGNYDN